MKRLRERSAAASIAAIDRRAVLDEARSWLDAAEEPDGAGERHLLAEVDLVILASPIAAIVKTMDRALDNLPPGGVVTDCGSVKRPMIAQAARHARGDRFVAGHPMAGREIGGFAASSPALFEGCRWFLISDGAAAGARERVSDMISVLGAIAVEVKADRHDLAMAYVSHAPQVVASALVEVAAAAGVLGDAGPGFRDTTRIAGGPEQVWRDILASNHANIVRALDEIIGRLTAARDDMARAGGSSSDEALRTLARARRARAGGEPQ